MKSKFWAIALLAMLAGFASCKDEKSKACNIETFTVAGEGWHINGLDITKTYPKGTNVSNLSPVIEVSAGAKVVPASGVARDFSNPVTYTVTAEDGKTDKSYTAWDGIFGVFVCGMAHTCA